MITPNNPFVGDPEFRSLLERSDEVFSAIDQMLSSGNHDMETLKLLHSESEQIAAQLAQFRSRKTANS
jgi:hypothetical protein